MSINAKNVTMNLNVLFLEVKNRIVQAAAAKK
jgi:hypothetical protein